MMRVRRTRLAIAAALLCVATGALAQREPRSGGGGLKAEWSGWAQLETAYTYASPGHLSKLRTRAEIDGKGAFGPSVKWKLGVRADYDAAYDLSDFYSSQVRRDQRASLVLREAYLDVTAGDWELRLGRQHVVWGEVVGLFFADVVSAKDLRESLLPDFDQLRIPQWAARAEWFGEDSHVELVWVGADFYPYPPHFDGYGYAIDPEVRPLRWRANGGLGIRASTLVSGWDLAAFAYRGVNSAPTFYRSLIDGPVPTVRYQPRHDRITRVGATLAKDFDGVVVKAEIVYGDASAFSLYRLDAGDGVAKLRTLDWILSADFTPADDWRVNLQLFQHGFIDHDPGIGLDRRELGASLQVAHTLRQGLDAEVLAISSLNRSDWLARVALVWKAGQATRVRLGVDAFGGVPSAFFGRYGNRDRLYAEVRRSF